MAVITVALSPVNLSIESKVLSLMNKICSMLLASSSESNFLHNRSDNMKGLTHIIDDINN